MAAFLSRVSSDLYKPCSTHLAFSDELLEGGIPNQTLTLVMAASAIGKTALCQQMADAIAESKRKVVYVSYEMSKEQLWARDFSCRLLKLEKNRSFCRNPDFPRQLSVCRDGLQDGGCRIFVR